MARFTVHRTPVRNSARLTLQDGAYGAGTLMRIAGMFMPGAAVAPAPDPDPHLVGPQPGSGEAACADANGALAVPGSAERAASSSAVEPSLPAELSGLAAEAPGGRALSRSPIPSPFSAPSAAGDPSPRSERSARSWRLGGVGSLLGFRAAAGDDSEASASRGEAASDQEHWESAEGSSGDGRARSGAGPALTPGLTPEARSSGTSAASSAAGSERNPDPGNPAQLQLFALDEDDDVGGSSPEAEPEPEGEPGSRLRSASSADGGAVPVAGSLEAAAGACERLLHQAPSLSHPERDDADAGRGACEDPPAAPAATDGDAPPAAPARPSLIRLRDQLTVELVRCRAVCPDWRELREAGAAGPGLGSAPGFPGGAAAGPTAADALVLDSPLILVRMPLSDPAPEPTDDRPPHPAQRLQGWDGQGPAPRMPRRAPLAPAGSQARPDAGNEPLLLCQQMVLRVAGAARGAAEEVQGAPEGPGAPSAGARLLTFASMPHMQLTVQLPPAAEGLQAGDPAQPVFAGASQPACFDLDVGPLTATMEPAQLQLLAGAAQWAPTEMAHILGRAVEQGRDPASYPTGTQRALRGSRDAASGAAPAPYRLEARIAAVALVLRGSEAVAASPGSPTGSIASDGASALALRVTGLQGAISRDCDGSASRGGGAFALITAAVLSWREARLRLVGVRASPDASPRDEAGQVTPSCSPQPSINVVMRAKSFEMQGGASGAHLGWLTHNVHMCYVSTCILAAIVMLKPHGDGNRTVFGSACRWQPCHAQQSCMCCQ
jgi:hypothetical protein